MMDARAGPCQHGILALFLIPFHQRDVEIAVAQVARHMIAVLGGVGLLEAEYGFVELGGLVEVVDLECDVNDSGHGRDSLYLMKFEAICAMFGKSAAAWPTRSTDPCVDFPGLNSTE